jgi:hypothetical protein
MLAYIHSAKGILNNLKQPDAKDEEKCALGDFVDAIHRT